MANAEGIYSMMQPQQCKESEGLLVESVSKILEVVHNAYRISCEQFYDHVKADPS